MTYEEIKGLHEMGFSNEEIIKLSTVSTGFPQEKQPEPQKETQPEPQKETPPEPQKDPAPKPIENPKPGVDDVQQLREEVKQLREQLQKSNRQNMFVESVPDDLQKKTDEIMAELIRPSIKEDKK